MSPTFNHQLFPARRRLEVTFRDNTPNLYLVDFLGEKWIDTALLPPGSALHQAITDTHYSMLTSHLKIKGIDLERAANSRFARDLGLFMYAAKWRHNLSELRQTTGQITISCGNVRTQQLESPEVAMFCHVDKTTAEERMLVWCAEQARHSA